jgi:predicted RND superfamily exporter protein
VPLRKVTCASVNTIAGGICRGGTVGSVDIGKLAGIFCPGTCANRCDAAGFGNASSARARANATVLVPELFEMVAQLRSRLLADSEIGVADSDIADITTQPFTHAPVRDVGAAIKLLQGAGVAQRTTAYQARFNRLTSYNHSATLIKVATRRTQANGGISTLNKIRSILQTETPWKDSHYGFWVYGGTAVVLDCVEEVFRESPPIVAGVTLSVMFAMTGLAFRSVVIPLRLLVTVMVTLVVVAGTTVLVFQVILGQPGIYWFVPICSACLCIGLTIDYDVYLISRVYEYRLRGFTTDASILRAMEKQSTTITTAGLIMAIAFSSLLLSNTTVLNQFGFVLVAASLVDTFVVRTMLVPALLFFATEKNWWPGPVPAPNRTTLVGSDDDDDDDATDACCGNCAMSS